MKKENWWRIAIFIVNVIIFIYGYIAAYAYKLGLCHTDKGVVYCAVKYNAYIDSLLFSSLFLGVVFIVVFFISDAIFKKWLKFAAIWIGLTILFIILAPVYSGGWMSFGPTKESVSIWMGSLFVLISLGMFVVLTIKEKKAISK